MPGEAIGILEHLQALLAIRGVGTFRVCHDEEAEAMRAAMFDLCIARKISFERAEHELCVAFERKGLL